MLNDASLIFLLTGLAAGAGVILATGLRITDLADRLADRTGLGEALIGGVLLGIATSLSGVIVTFAAALDARPSLAFSNAVGGIAAQTAFLAIADLAYRKANLEHAAAELVNVVQGVLLTMLLAIPVLAWAGPDWSVWGIHPASLLLALVYVLGVRGAARVRQEPMWHPRRTAHTVEDTGEEDGKDPRPTWQLALIFAGLMVIMGCAGWLIAAVAGELTDRYGLEASLIGALLTAVLTSLPELVTTLTAVRKGALQLAVGGIIGGNTFDVLFLVIADVGYREGSIYHAIGGADLFWLATGMVMTSILTLGLLLRQKDGPAGIGFESAGILLTYTLAVLIRSFATG